MKKQLKKLLCSVLMVCMVLSLFGSVQVQAAKKNKGDGSRTNPYSAYNWHKVDIYNTWGEYNGTVKIKLLKYMDGEEAEEYINKNLEYEKYKPKKYEEIIYMRFKIKCKKSTNGISCSNIIGNIYNFKKNKRINASVILSDTTDGLDNMNTTNLQKGGTSTCVFMATVKKDKSPYSFTIFDKNNNEIWFTTKK